MPSRRVHEMLDMLLFGKRYSWLHRWMDEPYNRLGKKHRQIRHDPWKTPLEALIISGGDLNAYLSAAHHIILDQAHASPVIIELLYRLKMLGAAKQKFKV